MKTIVIADPFQTGHHSTYLKYFAEAGLLNGWKVIVLGPDPEEIKDRIKLEIPDLFGKCYFIEYRDIYGSYNNLFSLKQIWIVINRWKNLVSILEKVSYEHKLNIDMVFLPWLDSYISGFIITRIFDQFFPYKWGALYFHPLEALPVLGKRARLVLSPSNLFKSKKIKAIGLLVKSVVPILAEKYPNVKVLPFPDIADGSLPEQKSNLLLDIENRGRGKFKVGLFGSLAKRKGILTLLKSIEKISSNSDLFFIIAGQLMENDFSEDELNLITNTVKKHNDKIFYYTNRLPEEADLNELMNGCDLIYAAYEEFYFSSNMLAKASIFKKPIIVSDNCYMADEVRKYEIGYVVPPADVESLIGLFMEIIAKQEKLDGLSKIRKSNYDKYLQDNSLIALKQALKYAVE